MGTLQGCINVSAFGTKTRVARITLGFFGPEKVGMCSRFRVSGFG